MEDSSLSFKRSTTMRVENQVRKVKFKFFYLDLLRDPNTNFETSMVDVIINLIWVPPLQPGKMVKSR